MPSSNPPGRPRTKPHYQRGGNQHDVPRSLGLVLKAIRYRLGRERGSYAFSQADMRGELEKVTSPFGFPERKNSAPNNSAAPKNRAAMISKWEAAEENISFGAQHRYGLLSNTRTSVIHLVATTFAHIRDATKPDVDEATRDREFAQAKDGIERFKALLSVLGRVVGEYEEGRGSRPLYTGMEHLEDDVACTDLINDLLDGYRKTRA